MHTIHRRNAGSACETPAAERRLCKISYEETGYPYLCNLCAHLYAQSRINESK